MSGASLPWHTSSERMNGVIPLVSGRRDVVLTKRACLLATDKVTTDEMFAQHRRGSFPLFCVWFFDMFSCRHLRLTVGHGVVRPTMVLLRRVVHKYAYICVL